MVEPLEDVTGKTTADPSLHEPRFCVVRSVQDDSSDADPVGRSVLRTLIGQALFDCHPEVAAATEGSAVVLKSSSDPMRDGNRQVHSRTNRGLDRPSLDSMIRSVRSSASVATL
jgi:hypothetical protein